MRAAEHHFFPITKYSLGPPYFVYVSLGFDLLTELAVSGTFCFHFQPWSSRIANAETALNKRQWSDPDKHAIFLICSLVIINCFLFIMFSISKINMGWLSSLCLNFPLPADQAVLSSHPPPLVRKLRVESWRRSRRGRTAEVLEELGCKPQCAGMKGGGFVWLALEGVPWVGGCWGEDDRENKWVWRGTCEGSKYWPVQWDIFVFRELVDMRLFTKECPACSLKIYMTSEYQKCLNISFC